MALRIAVPLACLGLATLACNTPTWQQPATQNAPRKNVMVQFTDSSLHPTTAQVLEGGTVTWVNYASEYVGSVFFSEEVVQGFTCSDLRPNWTKTGDGYQSIPITIGGATNDLDLPCPLKPGEYPYEVWLFSGPRSDFSAMDDPQTRMPGRIVVK